MTKKFFLALLMSCFALFASASNYLTFTAEEDSSSFCIKNRGDNNPNVEYSLDDGKTWIVLKNDIVVSFEKKGDKALLRGYNPDGFSGGDHYTEFHMQGKIAASGSVMSLIDGIGESKTIPSEYCFNSLFYDCKSLTQAPELPAINLADRCYEEMFWGCSNLTQASKLPATTLSRLCYAHMFWGCHSLIQAPELPATNLADGCYEEMFWGCVSLAQAPELPATTLAESCYWGMFCSCTSLTQAPELPATTLTVDCYMYMFSGCTNLTQAPELPATTLTELCYFGMFSDCKRLTQAPELPAMNLAEGCYGDMFLNCQSLTQAPELPAIDLAEGCYDGMFQNCKNLQKIKVGFDSWYNGEGTDSWVENVAPTGIFHCSEKLSLEYGVSYIPEGWNVVYDGTDVAEHVSDASFKAWAADGKITYTGATMPVEIFDINGRLVKKMNEKSQSVDVPQHGIYVVKSGNVSLKVEL